MSRPARLAAAVVASILAVGVVLGQFSGAGATGERPIAESPEDEEAGGLLALTLFLDGSGHPVERVGDAPSEADLDREKTAFLVGPGSITAADANALHDLAARGGRVVVSGDPGEAGLTRLLGTDAKIAPGAEPGVVSPLAPAPETQGVDEIESSGGGVFSEAGGALPLLGSADQARSVGLDVGAGRVVVVADKEIFQNELLGKADNALFALNLAGEEGRGVQFIEAVQAPPGNGLAALPSAWAWTAGGLLLAALALAWSKGRRLGPVEQSSRPLAPARRQYLDAVAGALLRANDPQAAAVYLRAGARVRLARRAGLPRDAPDARYREAAQNAGLEAAEVEALAGSDREDGLLASARALAKLEHKASIFRPAEVDRRSTLILQPPEGEGRTTKGRR